MRQSEKEMFARYLRRFLNPKVPISQKTHALSRYLIMGCQVIGERIKGLDYTMIYSTDEDHQEFNGSYTKTPMYVLKKVFADISFEKEKKRFIDIGCGKGYVVTSASKYPFEYVGGIEYNQHLYDVCCNNLKKNKISIKHIYHGNAEAFERYGDYNVFFFNNPVGASILLEALLKIWDAHKHDKIYIYYININSEDKREAFDKSGFHFVKIIKDGKESYFDIWVYCNMKEKDILHE